MPDCFEHNTTYFFREGKVNLKDCLRISFEAALQYEITKLVVFTALGQGVRLACEDFTSQDKYANIRIVAVTFPQGHPHPQDLSEDDILWMKAHKVEVVRAHLPFEPIRAQYAGRGILGQDFSLVGNALNIFGGGMSLAVQAVIMACDAGHVHQGEHVIALTADTSILVRSAPTSHLLTDFIVREIFCKAVILDISKREEMGSSSEALEAEDGKLIDGDKL